VADLVQEQNVIAKELNLPLLKRRIKAWASECGFSSVGITDIDFSKDKKYLDKWIENGFHGEMHYMERNLSKRENPEELVNGTKRIISLTMNYLPQSYNGKETLENTDKAFVSGYATGRDYHKLMRSRLKKLVSKIKEYSPHENRVFVDSAPVLEKSIARKAGLGWVGKNTLLMNKKSGSYFFLGEIYTDLELPVDKPHTESHCGTCTSCMDVCPTDAFVGPYQLDARKCISYLTIEHKGSIDIDLRSKIGNRIFGCDDCQIFCPWNKFTQHTAEEDFQPRHNLDDAYLCDLFLWSEEEFNKKTEGSAIRRAGYVGWLRNISVALGNADYSIKNLETLRIRENFPSEIVREHVNWAIQEQLRKVNE